MAPLPEDLDLAALRRRLDTRIIGNVLARYERVASTSELARQQARAGHPEGLVVLAEEQSAGRGRVGRSWIAPYGEALLLSVLLRPTWLPPAEAFTLTMLAALALCEAVERTVPIAARLKWPNDLLLPATDGLRKAAGILTELSIAGDHIEWAVIGIGVNVNQAPDETVDGRDLRVTATSLSAVAGRSVERAPLLEALLARLDERYMLLHTGAHTSLFAEWRARLERMGELITVRLPGGEISGIAEDVASDGTLLLRDTTGRQHAIHTGDVGF